MSTLSDLTDDLDTPDSATEWALRAAIKASSLPPGALGILEELAIWLAGVQIACPPPEPKRVRLIVFAGDHGVRAARVSANANPNSAQTVQGLRAGAGIAHRLAELVGVGVRIVDISVDADADPGDVAFRVRRGSGRIDIEDALTMDETVQAIAAGAAIADEEIDSGADLLVLGDVGIGSTTAAATLVAVLTGNEPVKVTGRGGGIDDATWMRKLAAIRDARFRAMPRRHDLDDVLTAVGGADIAAMAGFLLRAAARRTPVILDGVVTCAAALVAREADPRAPRWWQAAITTAEPAQAIALERLRLTPLTSTALGFGQGAGAVLAVTQLRAAVSAARELVSQVEPDGDPAPVGEPVPDGDPVPVGEPVSVEEPVSEIDPVLRD